MTVNEILNAARAELGVHEEGVNHVKYVDAYLGTTNYNGSEWPWCVIFLWYIFRGAQDKNGTALFANVAHCDGVRAYAKQLGRWYNHADIGEGVDIQPGDVVILDYNSDGSGDHICICETAANNNKFTTIEGNYADAVCRVNRTLEGVSGLYRPAYDDAPQADTMTAPETENAPEPENEPVGDVQVSLPVLSQGSMGDAVKALQALLILYGCSCGRYGIDGELGPDTAAALGSFQTKAGLTRDEICGAETWAALLRG